MKQSSSVKEQPSAAEAEFSTDGPRSEVRRLTPEVATIRHVRAARSIFSRVPVVVVSAETFLKAPLDNRCGFVLSLLDGLTSVEELLDLSGMSTEETLALLEDLRLRGIIEL